MTTIKQMEEEHFRPKSLMDRIFLAPVPQKLTYKEEYIPFPGEISICGLDGNKQQNKKTLQTLTDFFDRTTGVRYDIGGNSPFTIEFIISDSITNSEGYKLAITPQQARITAATATGLFYGAQTLHQIMAYSYFGCDLLAYSETPAEPDAREKKYIPLLSIEDHPNFKLRSFMIDPGRAPFSVSLIKRVIRIMASLKMNMLHIGIYNDQLCGFNFASLPLGSENPFAMTPAEFKEIVAYARSYHVTVMPELQSWGHIQSLLYHYPELFGGPGMWCGSSFAIGQPTFDLLEKIYDEIIPLLEDDFHLHVGMDEARWYPVDDDQHRDMTPQKLVSHVYDLVHAIAARHSKKATVHLWADHGGRPLEERVHQQVILEPWKYREIDEQDIKAEMQQYGGEGETPIMMGAGTSSVHYNGGYEATRIWCEEGINYPNVLGATLCLWESNDLASRLMTLYGGAQYLWSHNTAPKRTGNDYLGEDLRNNMDGNMKTWQALFEEATPALINDDRGPEVMYGKYVWPPMAGKAVAPTVDFVPQKQS